MTRAEKAERNSIIRNEYIKGISAKELSVKYCLSEITVYRICEGLTNPNNKGYADILRDHSKEVDAMLNSGHSRQEIANRFNVSKNSVADFTKRYGLKGKPNKNSESDAALKIMSKSGGLLEYVSGYTIKENPVRVRCTICGQEFVRTFHNITTKGRVSCPFCLEREREQIREAKEVEQKRQRLERNRKAQEREEERKRKSEARKNRPYHKCPVCGSLTQKPKYCCSGCRDKANWATKEHRRRARIQIQMVDRDITVEGLFRRDKGICSICGGRCDLEDYTVREGVFIAGDWYPSADHIKPISKGGLHSWGNVQLAHRRCNTLKSDKEPE